MSTLLDLIRTALPNGYTVQCALGSGGQGAVFRGQLDGRDVAIKLFGVADAERLNREISLLREINCSTLIQLVDATVIKLQGQQVPMLVYELAQGSDLRKRLSDSWRPDFNELVRLGVCVGQAIEALWERRIVHRDIKPENIVACENGQFILVDVGLAQHLELTTITRAGGQPGTQGYRSPEQMLGRKKLTTHSDVFSLGVTLYEVATGEHPWGRDQQAMVGREASPILRARPDLDLRLASLIHRMLSQRAGQRPVNLGTVFSQLGG